MLVYIAGYFIVMDRNLPTSPFINASDYFESSFRWASSRKASKNDTGPETPFPKVTFFNIIYRPMDAVYFRLIPRSPNDVERLKSIGYYR